MKTYTIHEFAEIAQVTTQRVNQWRTSHSKNGFKLVKGKDWKYFEGNIVYTSSAVTKVQEKNNK